MVEGAFFLGMEGNHDGEDRVAVLDRGDAPGRIALAVTQPLDLVDDRDLRIARQDEIAMDRMRQPALDGAACRYHRLPDHLAAEHPLPGRLRAVAAEQIHLELFKVKDGEQVEQAFGHMFPFVIPGHAKHEPRIWSPNIEILRGATAPHSSRRRAPRNDNKSPLFGEPVSPSYTPGARV